MKFSTTVVSLSLLFAGFSEAAHISNLRDLKNRERYALGRRGGASATYTPPSTSTPTATSSGPAPTTTASDGAAFSNGIKRGLSYNDISLTQQFSSNQVSWAYNWGSTASGNLPSGVQFVPMLWGNSDSLTSTWAADAQAAIDNGAEYLLGFNEPDLNTQSNMTPQEAADAWMQYMQPFAGKAKLIGPAVTNGAYTSSGAPMGVNWLSEFVSACSSCTFDGFAMHIYDSATNEAYYKSYIQSFVSQFGKPVWVTEFGATGSDSEIQTFVGDMVSFLDGLEGVAAYAWFMDDVGNLVNSDASLTPLANTYVATN